MTSAFNWNTGAPSIFVGASGFPAPRPNGHTTSTQMSAVIDRKTKETGRNPGTISGLASSPESRIRFAPKHKKK